MSAEAIIFLNHNFEIIRKKKRRALSVKLRPHVNQVLANFSISNEQIQNFLLSKKTWLEKNLKVIENQKLKSPTPEFTEGSLFPFFGELKYFSFADTKLKKITFTTEDGFLVCHRPLAMANSTEAKARLKMKLKEYYKSIALPYLQKRAQELARIMDLYPADVKIQTARTRWGSCTSQKNILLNWKLIVFPKVLIDYVIIHELCHLQHMNHSGKFWQLVEWHCPNYKEIESEIKNQALWTYFLEK